MTDAILLVEDDENDVFFMQHALKRAGITNPIRVVRDGQQAIDYFESAFQPGSNSSSRVYSTVWYSMSCM